MEIYMAMEMELTLHRVNPAKRWWQRARYELLAEGFVPMFEGTLGQCKRYIRHIKKLRGYCG